ncbi:hypothetical protein LSCM1_05854 [Leishmania martiniquensis]|uniref:Uncharacterized protein n=1 Tax=Leishmania martiniquensis TaxID=1580590 RepID=A0A836GL49_9TRYP|nr:hypothetical protein LSCM1_05854 [Leishmania martiniquensis]
MQEAFLSSVLLPLTEKSGEVERVAELLDMLEHCFMDAFKMRTLPDNKSDMDSSPVTGSVSGSLFASASAASLDAGEEAKLLVVRAVANFHRTGAVRHSSFFQTSDYHPHAALFLLELLKSLNGNSQRWFRQLQLDSLDACLAIVEVIGMENVRLCLPGVVSVAVRHIRRAHHGKDSIKVCLAAIQLLRAALTISFSAAVPVAWVQGTAARLASTLRTILEPSALARGAHAPVTVAALKSLIVSILLSPAMAEVSTTPLGSLLMVAYAIVENMDHLHHLGDDIVGAAEATSSFACTGSSVRSSTDHTCMGAVMGSSWAMLAVVEALQYLRGVELLHLATTVARAPALRNHFFPLKTPPQTASSTAESADISESAVAIFLSVIRKCVRVVGTEMNEEALYTHRLPRKYPAGVVDEFLFCLAGALARLPTDATLERDCRVDNDDFGDGDETVGERLTNALLTEYDAVLQDWDAYAVHPAALYVLSRLVVWQFHPAQTLRSLPNCSRLLTTGLAIGDVGVTESCRYPQPADLTAGAFEQLWSIVAQPHLWAITQDEELCTYQQVHHRQVVAATLLRFLALSAEVLSSGGGAEAAGSNAERVVALERLFTLTLYLVLEKATASGIVHEAAMRCVEVYSTASGERDTLLFLLHHSTLIMDETSRAVREEHLRPAAASVLRGSLALLERRFVRGEESDSSDRSALVYSGTRLTALVRRRLSVTAMSASLTRASTRVVTLEEAAQVADFVTSTIHVARDALQLCSRYDSAAFAEDAIGRRAALSLLRDAFDLAAYLNYCVPQEAMDEEQERCTTSAHTRVRALQSVVLEAVYAVLQHCTVHDKAAVVAVQTVVRGLTCFLTTTAALTWADVTRQRLIEEAAERRRSTQRSRLGGRKAHLMTGEGEEGGTSEDERDDDPGRTPLPTPPPIDWPWMHYAPTAVDAAEVVDGAKIALPRSHLHTIYRVYLSLFALLREPVAAFATVAAGPDARTGMERRKLGGVAVAPALFEALSGLEAIRLLACDFLLHRMVEEVLPLVLLWHERARLPRIPTHTEERAKLATKEFVEHLYEDCKDSAELQESVMAKCRCFDLLPTSS